MLCIREMQCRFAHIVPLRAIIAKRTALLEWRSKFLEEPKNKKSLTLNIKIEAPSAFDFHHSCGTQQIMDPTHHPKMAGIGHENLIESLVNQKFLEICRRVRSSGIRSWRKELEISPHSFIRMFLGTKARVSGHGLFAIAGRSSIHVIFSSISIINLCNTGLWCRLLFNTIGISIMRKSSLFTNTSRVWVICQCIYCFQ